MLLRGVLACVVVTGCGGAAFTAADPGGEGGPSVAALEQRQDAGAGDDDAGADAAKDVRGLQVAVHDDAGSGGDANASHEAGDAAHGEDAGQGGYVPCGPTNCASGCCDSRGICQSPSDYTCGTAGGTCGNCTPLGTCMGGVCVSACTVSACPPCNPLGQPRCSATGVCQCCVGTTCQ